MKPKDGTVAVPPAAARFLKPLVEEARKRGQALYVVGGPVRDWLLGRPTFDLDLTVAGDPDPVANLCAKLIGGTVEPFGRFGTRRVIGKARFRVDVATTRTEKYAEPAALPEVTATGVPIEQDLFRRDFTINAMALRLDDDSRAVVDPYGGLRDLKARTLRVLHPELPWRVKLPDGVEPRLAALALALGPEKGRGFIDSFPFEHRLRAFLHDALALAYSDKSPRAKPAAPVAAAVKRVIARLPAAALKPCFLSGADLIKRGLKPGPDFHGILDEAARLQRSGKLKTRAAALAWLAKR